MRKRRRSLGKTLFPNEILRSAFVDMTRPLWGKYETLGAKKHMKKVETAITNIIHGRPVLNRDALINLESLDYYVSILFELQRE